MNYARIEAGIVVDMIVWDGQGWTPPAGAVYVEAPAGVGIGYSYAGGSFLPPAGGPAPTLEERAALMLAAVDAHLNTAARAKGYDSITNAALRAALPSSPFHAEGLAFGHWMDETYSKCYEVLAQVQAGEIAEPTREELIAMLPALELPA